MRKITLLVALLLATGFSYSQKKSGAKKPVVKTAVVKKAAPVKKTSILIPYRVKELWGFSDTLGNVKVQPIYKKLIQFYYYDNGKANFVMKGDKNLVVVNQDQKVVMPETVSANYDSISTHSYYPNHVHIYKDGYLGVYKNGKEIIKPIYRSIGSEPNESFIVSQKGLFGLFNGTGKMIIPAEYRHIEPSWDDVTETNFVWVAESGSGKKRFSDLRIPQPKSDDEIEIVEKRMGGQTIEGDTEVPAHIKTKYDKVERETGYNIYYVKREGLTGVFDGNTNSEIIALQYENIRLVSIENNGKIFLVSKNGLSGLVRSGNTILVPLEFNDIAANPYLEGFVLTKNGKKGFYIRNTIYPYIKPLYNDILVKEEIPVTRRWSFGLFKVQTDGGEGYVGENGVEFFKD
jgi:hypothetical protein